MHRLSRSDSIFSLAPLADYMPIRTWHWLSACVLTLALVMTPIVPSTSAGPTFWSTIDQTLAEYSPKSNLLVAEFSGNSCNTVHSRNEDESLAIASTFKLYVLGELARQVQAGEVSWDDRIVLRDELRSMPAGDYAFAPSGTSVSVEDLAAAMIAQSDNTATDHLIDYLGRTNVEDAFAAFGHSDPEVNQPLLLTRELFSIKMTQSTEWIQSFSQADEDDRLAMLSQEIEPLHIDPYGGWGQWNGPTAIDDVEWFATANDLCKVMVSLWGMGAQSGLEPVREILLGNRGGVLDTRMFPEAGYKGGYEAGVVNMTYVLERQDGRMFFVTAGYNHPTSVVDANATMAELQPVFACLGEEDGADSCTPA